MEKGYASALSNARESTFVSLGFRSELARADRVGMSLRICASEIISYFH